MNTILNISAYKFVPLPDAPVLRELLLERAQLLELKGTLLLAEEGIAIMPILFPIAPPDKRN